MCQGAGCIGAHLPIYKILESGVMINMGQESDDRLSHMVRKAEGKGTRDL